MAERDDELLEAWAAEFGWTVDELVDRFVRSEGLVAFAVDVVTASARAAFEREQPVEAGADESIARHRALLRAVLERQAREGVEPATRRVVDHLRRERNGGGA